MAEYTFVAVDANHTIEAVFALEPVVYTIFASAGVGGTISPAGEVAVPAGADQVFVIMPEPGYKIAQILVDGVEVAL